MQADRTKNNERVNRPPPEKQPGDRRVVYIENSANADSDHYRVFLRRLREFCGVDAAFDFGPDIVRQLLAAPPKERYDGIVTHVPHTRGMTSYNTSCDLLIELSDNMQVPIIGYTGIGDGDVARLGRHVDNYVRKSREPGADAVKVFKQLSRLWDRLDDIKTQTPDITEENGVTVLHGHIRHNEVLGLLGAGAIAKLCKQYPGDVFVTFEQGKSDENPWTVNGESIMGLLVMISQADHPLRFDISGTGPDAQELAKRLAKIISRRSELTITKEDLA